MFKWGGAIPLYCIIIVNTMSKNDINDQLIPLMAQILRISNVLFYKAQMIWIIDQKTIKLIRSF